MSGYGPLDLSDANMEGFDPLDPGSYNAEIIKVDMDAVKNPGGKMPIGTPIIKVQYRVLEPKIAGEVIDQDRRVFGQFVIPPSDYDAKKRATMTGMIGRFFVAMGYEEEAVTAPGFNPDFEALESQPCVITIGKEPKKI